MAATRTTKHRSPSDLRLPAVADPTRLGAAYEVLHSSDTRLNRHSHENINSTSDQGASPDPLSGFRRCVGSTFTPVATDSQITRSGILALGHGQEVSTLGLSPVGDTKVAMIVRLSHVLAALHPSLTRVHATKFTITLSSPPGIKHSKRAPWVRRGVKRSTTIIFAHDRPSRPKELLRGAPQV